MQQVRTRRGFRQADLARVLGCKQNTVSKWESGKAHPGTESLIRLWQMADETERKLIRSYLLEQFSFLSEPEQNAFMREALSPHRHFSLDIAALLSKPETPEFLKKVMSLYLRHGKRTDANEIFTQAVTWLSLQFQMREYVDRRDASREILPAPLRSSGDDAGLANLADLVRDEKRLAALEKRMVKLRASEIAAKTATPKGGAKPAR